MPWCYVLKQISSKNGEDVLIATGAKVAFHVGIPADENEVGISYRDALLEAADPNMTGVPSMIRDLESRFPERYAKLQSGEAIEIIEEVDYSSMHDSLAERAAAITARAATIEDSMIEILKIEYSLSGMSLDD